MKLATATLGMFSAFAGFTRAQTNGGSGNTEALATISEAGTGNYAVFWRYIFARGHAAR